MNKTIPILILFSLFSLVGNFKLNRDYKKMAVQYCSCLDNVKTFTDNVLLNVQNQKENDISFEGISSHLDTISEETAKNENVIMIKIMTAKLEIYRRYDLFTESVINLSDTDKSNNDIRINELANEFQDDVERILNRLDLSLSQKEIEKIAPGIVSASKCNRKVKPTLIMKFFPHNRKLKFIEKVKKECGFLNKMPF